MNEERRKGDRRIPPAVAQHLAEERGELLVRIAELEAHCVRLGQGGAERYWEGRWRDADAQIGDLVAHIERQDDAYALLSLDAGRKMEELERELSALKSKPDVGVRLVECDSCPRSGGCVESCMKSPVSVRQPSAGVVLPERPGADESAVEWAEGYNACLDEVASLNACREQSVPEGYVMVIKSKLDLAISGLPSIDKTRVLQELRGQLARLAAAPSAKNVES